MFSSKQNRNAIGALIAARVVYATNWLNLGAIFVLMGPELGAGVGGLGTVTSAFYLGLGIMQVPGGLLAAKWGPRNVVMLGIFMSSIGVLATSVSVTVFEIAALRFVVGGGMAFVFAPAVVLVARLFGSGSSGFGVGLFNSAFNIGGLFGLFVWIVIATATGWRPSLALGGGLGVLTGLLVMLYVPKDQSPVGSGIRSDVLGRILRDRQLVFLGLGTLGFSVGYVIIASFMEYYLVSSFGVSPALGGAVAAMIVVIPIFTAVWAGRLYDRTVRPKLLMLLSLAGGSLALVVSSYPSLLAALACAVIGGVVSGFGYTVAFAGARDLNREGEQYDGLAIAWVNCISLSGSFWPPLIYSYVAESAGYSAAWLESAALTLLFVIPLLLMKEGFRR